MRFVDYTNNRVLWWDNKSADISTDISGIIKLCNERNIPAFLEINYSDYVPGGLGTGLESLKQVDNITNTITFLKTLKNEGLILEGLTFGDEIEDESGFGAYKPTIYNSDLINKFISYARSIKSEFPELKIYAFDSYIDAVHGQVSKYWDFFEEIRQAEKEDGKSYLDGFIFRESYVYIDKNDNVLESQYILDDTESLYRDTTVYRYDVKGNSQPNPDKAYLSTIINKTEEIFGRYIDIGITEYLPSGPVQISEIDTSKYADIDFILHFSDVVGIYAQLGLNFVSKIMYGDSVDMHKAYFDREGNHGYSYEVHDQLAQYFSGNMLNVERSVDYDNLKVKVYATRQADTKYFIMILNKDVDHEASIRITLPEHLDLKVRIPNRSYTSIIIDDDDITISGIENSFQASTPTPTPTPIPTPTSTVTATVTPTATPIPVTAGNIAGYVTNADTGDAIGGATISAAGQAFATTNSLGAYAIQDVPDGSYSLTASASGYTPATQNVMVIAGETATANFKLEVVVCDVAELIQTSPSGKMMIVKGEKDTITVIIRGANNCAVSGVTVKASNNDTSKVKVLPSSATTNTNGLATFTVKGRAKGSCTLTFNESTANLFTKVKIMVLKKKKNGRLDS